MSGYTSDTQTAGAPPLPEIRHETERSIKSNDQMEILILSIEIDVDTHLMHLIQTQCWII